MSIERDKLQMAARMGEHLLQENSKLRQQIKTLHEANENLQFERNSAKQDAERAFGPKLKAQDAYLVEAEQQIEELTHALEKSIAANESKKSKISSVIITPRRKTTESEELPQTPTSPLRRYTSHRRSTRILSRQRREEKDNGTEDEGSLSSSSNSSSSPDNSFKKAQEKSALIVTLRQEINSMKQQISNFSSERKLERRNQDEILSELTHGHELHVTDLLAQIELLTEKNYMAEQRAAVAEEKMTENSINLSNGTDIRSTIGDELVRALTTHHSETVDVGDVNFLAKIRKMDDQENTVMDAECEVYTKEEGSGESDLEVSDITADISDTTHISSTCVGLGNNTETLGTTDFLDTADIEGTNGILGTVADMSSTNHSSGIADMFGSTDSSGIVSCSGITDTSIGTDTSATTDTSCTTDIPGSNDSACTLDLSDTTHMSSTTLSSGSTGISSTTDNSSSTYIAGITGSSGTVSVSNTIDSSGTTDILVHTTDILGHMTDILGHMTDVSGNNNSAGITAGISGPESTASATPQGNETIDSEGNSKYELTVQVKKLQELLAAAHMRIDEVKNTLELQSIDVDVSEDLLSLKGSPRKTKREALYTPKRRRRCSVSSDTTSEIRFKRTPPVKPRSNKHRRRSSCFASGGIMLVLTRLLFPEISRVSPEIKLINKAHQAKLKAGIKLQSPKKHPLSFL